MENTRASYSAEEKKEMILAILTKKTTIQKIAQEKGIAPTLISLWKKQAIEAMASRFCPQPKGRRKRVPESVAPVDEAAKATRNELRAVKIKAAHLENSLRASREKLEKVEAQLAALAAIFGCTVAKERKPRKSRKA